MSQTIYTIKSGALTQSWICLFCISIPEVQISLRPLMILSWQDSPPIKSTMVYASSMSRRAGVKHTFKKITHRFLDVAVGKWNWPLSQLERGRIQNTSFASPKSLFLKVVEIFLRWSHWRYWFHISNIQIFPTGEKFLSPLQFWSERRILVQV